MPRSLYVQTLRKATNFFWNSLRRRLRLQEQLDLRCGRTYCPRLYERTAHGLPELIESTKTATTMTTKMTTTKMTTTTTTTMFSKVELLNVLLQEEKRSLAEALIEMHFQQGEYIIRQGEQAIHNLLLNERSRKFFDFFF